DPGTLGKILREHVAVELDLAVPLGTNFHLRGVVVAVNLSSIPPMRIEVAECRRGAQPGLALRGIGRRALDVHAAAGFLRPVVTRWQRNFEFVSCLRRSVTEPVMDLELDPGGREKVEGGGGNELMPRQQLARYHAGTWLEQRVASLGHAFDQGNVACKPRSRHSHARMRKAIV